jgi:two-component system nitrogen regulation response regulator GlnG
MPRVAPETEWTQVLAREVQAALIRGERELMDRLTRRFEAILIGKALAHTSGRRIEAAQLLGIGRNTITRKIQELGLEGEPGDGSAPDEERD